MRMALACGGENAPFVLSERSLAFITVDYRWNFAICNGCNCCFSMYVD